MLAFPLEIVCVTSDGLTPNTDMPANIPPAPIKNATTIPIIATLRFNAEFPFPKHTGGVAKGITQCVMPLPISTI
ncbi:Uncharacterised protein [Streptococcus pneumoniae]|nr:Uncharacterised protein [Streptococcus pneumoniae]CJD53920.1 Uncharacterised protein [Streptococcus pneumoniae]COF08685.1 Uncharacterised protein [Streptococcus pneumoniae]COF28466.1 Uncharacterised protein [Streptococcus pneumoniae]COG11040.1 Uncharacterised protein [Streptococcus pneumoniae]